MNWVAPIKDPETLEAFKRALKKANIKYYIMFEIGVGTGIQLQDILKYRVRDLKGKDSLKVQIGTRKMERTFNLSEELQKTIAEYTKNMKANDYMFQGHKLNAPLTREQAYRAMKSVSVSIGISSIGAQTMRKTFAWNYYHETGDIYYLQQLFNHASPTITYRFIGEKPNVEVPMKKMTASENERCRKSLCENGQERVDKIVAEFSDIKENILNPAKSDSFYGSVDCLLSQVEELFVEYKQATQEK